MLRGVEMENREAIRNVATGSVPVYKKRSMILLQLREQWWGDNAI